MTKSRYPFHLRSKFTMHESACGLFAGNILQWRSIARVDCKNCLKLIEANKETAYFSPRKAKPSVALAERGGVL